MNALQSLSEMTKREYTMTKNIDGIYWFGSSEFNGKIGVVLKHAKESVSSNDKIVMDLLDFLHDQESIKENDIYVFYSFKRVKNDVMGETLLAEVENGVVIVTSKNVELVTELH